MVLRQLMWCSDCKQHQFGLKSADSSTSFGQRNLKKVVVMAQNGNQEPVSHHNIIHGIHMDDIEWFSIN